jgi:hypothetical protein
MVVPVPEVPTVWTLLLAGACDTGGGDGPDPDAGTTGSRNEDINAELRGPWRRGDRRGPFPPTSGLRPPPRIEERSAEKLMEKVGDEDEDEEVDHPDDDGERDDDDAPPPDAPPPEEAKRRDDRASGADDEDEYTARHIARACGDEPLGNMNTSGSGRRRKKNLDFLFFPVINPVWSASHLDLATRRPMS